MHVRALGIGALPCRQPSVLDCERLTGQAAKKTTESVGRESPKRLLQKIKTSFHFVPSWIPRNVVEKSIRQGRRST